MRTYWDDSARRNAAWYVDTSLAYDDPDLEQFAAGGEQIVTRLFDEAPVAPSGHALAIEIGSGLGRVCDALARRFDRVVGVDVSPEMVRQATELVTNPAVSFRVGDGVGLDGIETGSADLVLSFTVFQHIPRARIVHGYLAEAARVLRPGGLLAFQWNNEPGAAWWAVRRTALSALQRSGMRAERFRRNAPAFLGTRVPLTPVRRTLERHGVELRGTTGLGSLFAIAWATKR
jgi:SAM-dependent methyltransferase